MYHNNCVSCFFDYHLWYYATSLPRPVVMHLHIFFFFQSISIASQSNFLLAKENGCLHGISESMNWTKAKVASIRGQCSVAKLVIILYAYW